MREYIDPNIHKLERKLHSRVKNKEDFILRAIFQKNNWILFSFQVRKTFYEKDEQTYITIHIMDKPDNSWISRYQSRIHWWSLLPLPC